MTRDLSDRFDDLPDWAQKEIAELEAEVHDLRLAVRAYGSQDAASNVMVYREAQAGGSYYLPVDSEVQYTVGISPVDDRITIRHGGPDRSGLYAIARTGTLGIYPVSESVIQLRVKAA